MNATIATDRPTIEMSRTQMLELQLQSASVKTASSMVGEALWLKWDISEGAKKILSSYHEEQLMDVIDELIEGADGVLTEDHIDQRVVKGLNCATMGIVYMGAEGSSSFHKKLNHLLNMLVKVQEAVNN